MTMKTSDLIAAPSRADVDDALAGLTRVLGRQPTGAASEFLTHLAFACDEGGIDFAFTVAHTSNEADYYRDSDFVRDRNPAGIGHPDNASSGLVFPSYRVAARFYVGELCLKLQRDVDWISDPGGAVDKFTPALRKKWDSVRALVDGAAGEFPKVERIRDLNKRFGPGNREATWMTDPSGPEAIVSKGNALFPNLKDQEDHPTVPSTFSTPIPGLPGGPLVTTYPIFVNLIPASNTRQRPGIPARLPRRSVQHGTANPSNDNAAAEARYFVNGAEGRQASVHYCTDDVKAVVVVPLSEVTWQAADGAGPGNMNGFSCEMMEADAIWNDPARRDHAISVAADLMGRTAARLDCHTGPEMHWTFNAGSPDRHDCPNKLRHVTINGRLAWDIYAERWNAARIDELRRMGGTVTPTTSTTARPIPTTAPPKPKPQKAKLPKGTSTRRVDARFNPLGLANPRTGQKARFNPAGTVSQVYLRHVLDSNPAGKVDEDFLWPALASITKLGNGKVSWQFSDGFVWTQD